jgi:uncharacterized DUF497 family protein
MPHQACNNVANIRTTLKRVSLHTHPRPRSLGPSISRGANVRFVAVISGANDVSWPVRDMRVVGTYPPFIEASLDSAKSAKNLLARGISFDLAAEFEWDSALLVEDLRKDYGERRFQALGLIGATYRKNLHANHTYDPYSRQTACFQGSEPPPMWVRFPSPLPFVSVCYLAAQGIAVGGGRGMSDLTINDSAACRS